MKVLVEVKGEIITNTHCSGTSSIGKCEKLDLANERCRLFKSKLIYDWDTHSCKRCEECLDNEFKED